MNPESIYYLFEAGGKRKQEDYIWPIPGKATVNDRVFIVCDGTGSFSGGDIASKLICEFMAAKVMRFPEQRMSEELVNNLLTEARDRLISYAREYRLDTDMATTFSMVVLYDQKVFLSWCGDSRIYHVRDGEILFRTKDDSLLNELMQENAIAGYNGHEQRLVSHKNAQQAISADSTPIYAETKWIHDVQAGDYFLVCSKGLLENVSEDDIRSLLGKEDQNKIDPVNTLKQLTLEKAHDNYSMYLVRVNPGVAGKALWNGNTISRQKASPMTLPVIVLAITILGALILFLNFRSKRTFDSTLNDTNKSTQQASDLRTDSTASEVSMPQSKNIVPMVTDPVRKFDEAPKPIPKKDSLVQVQPVVKKDEVKQDEVKPPEVNEPEEKPSKAAETPVVSRKTPGQLLIKFTADESCKLRIQNLTSDEVIDWDLSSNENVRIYLKPGKYSIIATSEIDNSKTKTYQFNVRPEDANSSQNIRIAF